MDWLTNIKSFIDVADYQSFTQAATERHSSPAVLSRRVAWLEDRLGVTLMQRTTRSLQLTEEGHQFYAKGKQWLAYLNEITLLLQNQQQVLKGPIHITMPYSFGETKLVSELMAKFAVENPHIEFNLNFSNVTYDLIKHDIDIAFRALPYHGAGYTSIIIATVQLGIYGSPVYFSTHGVPKKIPDLTEHNCMLHQEIGYAEWEFQGGKKIYVSGNIKTNSTRALINFCRQGVGLIRMLDCYVNSDVAVNTLQPVLEKRWQTMNLYLVYKDRPTIPHRVQIFIDYIKTQFSLSYLTL
ncbi:LysR family transcriptional regulator [soil metagenome]